MNERMIMVHGWNDNGAGWNRSTRKIAYTIVTVRPTTPTWTGFGSNSRIHGEYPPGSWQGTNILTAFHKLLTTTPWIRMWTGCKAPRVLYLCTRRTRVVIFIHWTLHLRRKGHVTLQTGVFLGVQPVWTGWLRKDVWLLPNIKPLL
jgi:hypothetical protein